MSPQIPGMPMPLPPTDPGQGEHGSQPWYSRADNYLWAEQVTVAIAVADGLGWTHAAAHLRHYLENTGDDLKLDPDQIILSVRAAKRTGITLSDPYMSRPVAPPQSRHPTPTARNPA